MNIATLLSVKYCALLLIEANGTTTTLEVKDHLRDLGYKATQTSISELMNQAAEELPLSYTTTGKYRVYTTPQLDDVLTAAPLPVVPSVAQPPGMWVYTRKDQTKVTFYAQHINSDAMWEVSSDTTSPVFFDSKWNRDIVRTAYASTMKVPFHNVRAKLS